MLRNQFKNYLVDRGYKLYTNRGCESTVFAYIKSIERVCEWQGCTIIQLARNIKEVVKSYEPGGNKASLGAISHNTVISALRRFEEFIARYK